MNSIAVPFLVVAIAADIGLALRGRGSHSTLITRTREPIAIVLLLIGLGLFAVGWLIGVALLWSSPTWRVRDKLLGTLVLPGGLPMGALLATFGLAAIFDWNAPTGATFALYILLAAFFVLSPIYTAVHL